MQVSFWACPTYHGLSGTNKDKISSASGTTYAKYIEIGTCTDPADTSTYTVLKGWTYEVEGDNLKTGVQADATNDYAFRKVTVKLNNATGPYVFIRPNVDRGDGKSFTYSTMYIDDLQFETLANCEAPTNLKATDVTIHDAKIEWTSEANSYDLQVSTDPTFTDDDQLVADTTKLTATVFTVEGLQPNMQYFYRVKAYCDADRLDGSDWTTVANFKTPYAPMYNEEFTTSLGEWKMAYGYADKIFSGEKALRDTTTTGTYNSWYRAQNLAISGYCVRMLLGYAASANPTYPISSTYQGESYLQKYWLVGPSMTIEKENAQLTFEAALTNYTTADPIYAHDHWNEGWDDQFMVIISDDDGATWKRENATIWNNEKGTQPGDSLYKYGQGDYVLTDIPATPKQYSIDLNKYTGKTIRIALYGENSIQNAMNAVHVDKIHVNYVSKYEENMELCQFEDVDDVLGFSLNGDTVSAGMKQLQRSVLSQVNGENDSLFILNVNYKEAPQYNYEITICEGTPFEYMGFNQHTTPGTYRMKLISQVTGCDSIVNFTIKHTEALRTDIDTTICQGDYISFGGKQINEAGTYIDTLQACELYGGCDSIVTLHLGIRGTNHVVNNQTILHGESYEWYGYHFTESIVKDTVFTNAAGCDSTIVLNLTVKYAEPQYVYDTICKGDSYTWMDKSYSMAGAYNDTVRVAGQADQPMVLNLTVIEPVNTTITTSILHGESYQWFDEELTESAVKDTVLVSAAGCDSIVTLSLTVKYADVVYSEAAICQGDTYTWLNKEYSAAGTYLDTVRVEGQADQVLGLVLTVNKPTSAVLPVSILHGESYPWFDEVLTESAVKDTVITNVAGCDSVVTLNLTVTYKATEYVSDAVCQGESYTWLGKEYSAAGTYYDTVRTAGAADQPMALVLSVNMPSAYEYAAQICEGDAYDFNGQLLSEAGTYHDTLANMHGCDSIVTLRLTVYEPENQTLDVTICHGSSYLFNGVELAKTGTYYDSIVDNHGCDAIITLNLTVNEPLTGTHYAEFCGESYTYQGVPYTAGTHEVWIKNEQGCDSIVTLVLTQTYDVHDTLNVTLCAGETYSDENFTVNKPGTYYSETVQPGGCTTFHVLYFANYESEIEQVDSVLTTELPFSYMDLYYGIGTQPGVYVDTINTISVEGCDLTIYHTLYVTENQGVIDIYVEDGKNIKKVIYQNQMYIVRPDGWYNVSGQKVDDPTE